MIKSVLTIGTFDGVHLGHQGIIRQTCDLAKEKKCLPVAITFDQPPRLFFNPSQSPSLLTSVPEKHFLLKKFGIKKVVLLKFNRNLSQISAEKFFKNFMVHRYRPAAIVVGYNFGFGRNREGDTRFLEKMGQKYSVSVIVSPPVCFKNFPVSSGRIREFLKEGNLQMANRLLGYPYFIMGRAARGEGLGRKLGFPTANLAVPDSKIVVYGVFAVRVFIENSKKEYKGMCNIGFRPTVSSPLSSRSVEVHLFNFSGNLYGRSLRIELVKMIRPEKKFSSLLELKKQIERDKGKVLKIL